MGKKILVVDDEPDLLEIAVFRLKKAGYEIITAIDGNQALDIISSIPLDLVLLDLLLPGINGVEVSRRIKTDRSLCHIPVILFTASTIDIREKNKEALADDYLTKPFDLDVLLRKIDSLLK
ncbi:MAG: response regulator [Candidatus Omnitrophica bacterium]|nr:response regulator [Candidatus Omnitrophota bacterium]